MKRKEKTKKKLDLKKHLLLEKNHQEVAKQTNLPVRTYRVDLKTNNNNNNNNNRQKKKEQIRA